LPGASCNCRGNRGKADLNVETPALARLGAKSGVVSLGNGGDDRQAEAEALVIGGSPGGQALERLK
jgi:hypothetical protein